MSREIRAVRYRPCMRSDEPFLWTALYHAIHVPPGADAPPTDIVRSPALARYVEGWSDDDLGVIAEMSDGISVGAAWLRLLQGERSGFGHVADDVPELGIAVLREWRRQGVGSAMLQRLLDAARQRHPRVSLSVNRSNPAYRLYAQFGFRDVTTRGDAIVMVLDLDPAAAAPGRRRTSPSAPYPE